MIFVRAADHPSLPLEIKNQSNSILNTGFHRFLRFIRKKKSLATILKLKDDDKIPANLSGTAPEPFAKCGLSDESLITLRSTFKTNHKDYTIKQMDALIQALQLEADADHVLLTDLGNWCAQLGNTIVEAATS